MDAKKAFTRLTYYRLKNQPLYLEWAPSDVFSDKHYSRRENTTFSNTKQEKVEKDMKLLSTGKRLLPVCTRGTLSLQVQVRNSVGKHGVCRV